MTPNDFISSCAAVGLMIIESDIWIVALQRLGGIAVFGYAVWAVLTALAVGMYLYKKPKAKLDARLISLCKKHDFPTHKIIQLPQPSHAAFTAGIIQPKVYLSTGLINALSNNQLEAVFLHELHHLQNHDSRIAILLLGIRGIRVVVPFFHDIEVHIKASAEHAADQFVIKKQGTSRYVQQALDTITSSDQFPLVGAHFADINNSRNRLTSHRNLKSSQLRIAPLKILTSLVVGIFWTVVYSWHLLQPVQAQIVQKQPASCTLRDCISTCMGRGTMTENKNFSPAETPDT